MSEIAQEVRHFMHRRRHGILSTISCKFDGHPFGSVVPYCLDVQQNPIIYISDIAEHTKNILADNRVSLTITEQESIEQQAQSRATILAVAEQVDHEQQIERQYFNYFPSAKKYREAHGFHFYRLKNIAVRFIGGFGKIYFLENEKIKINNPYFSTKGEILEEAGLTFSSEIKSHLQHQYAGAIDSFVICGIDQEGIDLVIDDAAPFRIPFSSQGDQIAAIKDFIEKQQT